MRSSIRRTGRMVDIGGYQLHINCSGKGKPTVILLHGLGDFSFDWALVQPELALTTRVCAYDRAGVAWSEPGPQPRGPLKLAQELHVLLQNSSFHRVLSRTAFNFSDRSRRAT